MNLIIDIGNTDIKIAIFKTDNLLVHYQRIIRDNIIKDLERIIQEFSIAYSIISQVGKSVPRLNEWLTAQHIPYLYLTAKLKLPFDIHYKSPKTIGSDRLGLVAGAILKNPESNTLIIDAGTCVTYDFIDQNNIYHGGAISPGLKLRFKSLNDYTEKLPLLQPDETTISLIGNDTFTSIQSGVIYGLANEIDGFIVKYNLNFTNLTVYLTGGDEKLLDRYIKNKIFVSSKFLLLEGLNFILNLNK